MVVTPVSPGAQVAEERGNSEGSEHPMPNDQSSVLELAQELCSARGINFA